MTPFHYPQDEVTRELSVSATTLLRDEGRGLIRTVRRGSGEGYGPAEVRQLGTILTFRRDPGINLTEIEIVLRLRGQRQATPGRLDRLARAFQASLDGEPGPAHDD